MINHRGPEFKELLGTVTADLQYFFQTRNEVVILTGSGTGGLEAAIVNLICPGDQVVAIENRELTEARRHDREHHQHAARHFRNAARRLAA